MAQKIRNDKQLLDAIMPQLSYVVNFVMEQMLKKNELAIKQIVYNAYRPKDYQRTGEFNKAWDKTVEKNSTNTVQGKMYYDPDSMSVGWPSTEPGTPEYGRHASAIDNFDVRPYLAEIIYEGLSGPAFGHGVENGPWHNKRDVWERLLKELNPSQVDKWIREGCNQAGIKVERRNVKLKRY